MSKQKYVESTLTLPSSLPLFNYNINFDGLRKLLQEVNVKTNSNEEEIKKLQQNMQTKLPASSLQQTQKKLNGSYLFGLNCQKYIDKQQEKVFKVNKINPKQMPDLDEFCWKMNRIAEIVEYLFIQSENHEEKINGDNRKHQKLIDESFRRLQEKMNSGLDSFTKTINSYFTQTNQKVSQLQSEQQQMKLNTQSKFEDLNSNLLKKLSQSNLRAALEGSEIKIKKQLQAALKNDHMQRLATVNEMKNAFKDAEKQIDLKNKAMTMKMQQLSQKVSKALQVNSFELEKHKIYERLSQLKNRTDDLIKKNGQFFEFRKNYLSNNQKIKQEMIGLNQQIHKIQNKQEGFKKLQNMSDVINSLNPHLICQIGQEVKLHTKEIGKLEKSILALTTDLKDKAGQRPVPEVNTGQNSEIIQKIIKEFMSNLDFDGRMKRAETDIQNLRKRNDTFIQLQKKIYTLSKQMDMGAIMKELRKKCDQENTKKDTRILDGKIEQLFQFYKQLRKQMDQKRKTSLKSDPFENASLTTKKLVSANCLSCQPSTPSTRRQYSKAKMEMSLDYGIDSQKNSIYTRLK